MAEVCVVLPTYNRERFLARAVDSVLGQTFADWELRIVDDGSTDDTAALAATYVAKSDRVSYERQENRGVSAARNRAIFSTRAPWIACLDSDDEWLPDKLQKQLNYAAQNPGVRIIHGEEIWMRGSERLLPKKKHQKGGGRIFQRCLPLCCISPSTVMLKTELVRCHGGFREDFPVCEDYDLWLKICADEEVGFLSDVLTVKHGGRPDQLSHQFKAMDEYRVRSLWEMRAHAGLNDDERQALLQELLVKCAILIRGFEKHGRPEKAAAMSEIHRQAVDQLNHL